VQPAHSTEPKAKGHNRAAAYEVETLPPDLENEVRFHLESILASSAFCRSRRLSSFLQYIVEQTLAGRAGELKERTIGIEVFGREADYDTASDHSVRVAAAEIRKRLAQYYQDIKSDPGLRIELRPGCYVPHFRFLHGPAAENHKSPEAKETEPAAAHGKRSRGLHIPGMLLLVAAGLAGIAFLAFAWSKAVLPSAGKEALRSFWAPLKAENSKVLLCIGHAHLAGGALPAEMAASAGATAPLGNIRSLTNQFFHAEDTVAASRLAGVLRINNMTFQVLSDLSTTLDDLKDGPVVFLGLRNNRWSLPLLENARFKVTEQGNAGENSVAIVDTFAKNDKRWLPILSAAPADQTRGISVLRDYGLIIRTIHPQTHRTVVLAGGINGYGTLAVSEFLSNSRYFQDLLAQAPRGWEKRQMEIVVSVDVISGSNGPPKLVAAHFW